MTTRHILDAYDAYSTVHGLEGARCEPQVHPACEDASHDQSCASRIHYFNRCWQARSAKRAVVLVIDVHGGVAVEGRGKLPLLQEKARVAIKEEPLVTIFAGHRNYAGMTPFDSVHERSPCGFRRTDLVRGQDLSDFKCIESLAFIHFSPALSFVDPRFLAVPHHRSGVFTNVFRYASTTTSEQDRRRFLPRRTLAAVSLDP